MRTVKKIHRATSAPIADLITYRALPTSSIQHIDPFLFLNHHGPQVYPPGNRGLPFGPHPHRGFETLTFIYEGDLVHWDSGGGKSKIEAGGIQWMTAGSGLIHAEISSDEFKQKGGDLEIIQLWFNLPSSLKMSAPSYIGKQKADLPEWVSPDTGVRIVPVSGDWEGVKGPVKAPTGIEIASIYLTSGSVHKLSVPPERNILCYIVRGRAIVNGHEAETHHLIEFGTDDEQVQLEASQDSLIILGHGAPYHEPIVAEGPFVMNSAAEIRQAYADYQAGKMGDPGVYD